MAASSADYARVRYQECTDRASRRGAGGALRGGAVPTGGGAPCRIVIDITMVVFADTNLTYI